MQRLVVAVLSFLILCSLSQAQFAQPSETASGMTWQVLKIGAGGFLTGIDIASDGTKVVRADTFGAYVWNSGLSKWTQLVSTASMPAADVGYDPQGSGPRMEGVYEIAIAPSNTRRFYMMYGGRVYRTDDAGSSWTRTSFMQVPGCNPNDSFRGFGRKMAVDPQNPDVVYIGTAESGLFQSLDAGSSWTRISTVQVSANRGGVIIAFDPTSSVIGGKTQIILASSYGRGVYRSTDGGSTWMLTSGGPTTHRHMVADQKGNVWLTDDAGNGNTLWKFAAGAWSNIATAGQGHRARSIAIDPANAGRIFLGIDSGDLIISTNGGASWSNITFGRATRTATDIPWLAWTKEDYMTNGNMAFDPTGSNKIYFASGIGVWWSNPPNANTTVAWQSQSAGIEQLVANWIISPPGGKPVVISWDRPAFYINDPDVYPSTHGPNREQAINLGASADWASATPSFIAGLFSIDSGYSSDGGRTWTKFSSLPAGAGGTGGTIAASTTANIVWIPSDSTAPVSYTTDGGANWSVANISGVPTSGATGWMGSYFIDRQIVCADRVNANTFYAYNNGISRNTSFAGVYKSIDGGANWSRVKAGVFTNDGVDGYNAKLRCVPGQAGHLFYSAGDVGGSIFGSFFRSTNAGSTWSAVPNVREVLAFGFGKEAPGQSYPAIYIAGWVRPTGSPRYAYGIWRSIDNASSWTKLADYPNGNFDLVKCIEGDANTYGTVYVGFMGSGFAYGKLQ